MYLSTVLKMRDGCNGQVMTLPLTLLGTGTQVYSLLGENIDNHVLVILLNVENNHVFE